MDEKIDKKKRKTKIDLHGKFDNCYKYSSLIGESRMEERKLIKVIMEYDNGDKEYIEEDDVDKWQKALNNALIDYTHRGHAQDVLKDITWRKV